MLSDPTAPIRPRTAPSLPPTRPPTRLPSGLPGHFPGRLRSPLWRRLRGGAPIACRAAFPAAGPARRLALGLGLALGIAAGMPAAAQDAAPVGALLADYDGLPESHPGRMIIENAVGNYALGIVDAGGDCPRYRAARPATASRLFLAWVAAARDLPRGEAASTDWRSSVAGWIPVHCGA